MVETRSAELGVRKGEPDCLRRKPSYAQARARIWGRRHIKNRRLITFLVGKSTAFADSMRRDAQRTFHNGNSVTDHSKNLVTLCDAWRVFLSDQWRSVPDHASRDLAPGMNETGLRARELRDGSKLAYRTSIGRGNHQTAGAAFGSSPGRPVHRWGGRPSTSIGPWTLAAGGTGGQDAK